MAQAFSGTYVLVGSTNNVASLEYNGMTIPDLTPSALTKVGITSSSSSGNFRGNNWPTGATTGSDTFTGSVDLGKYIQFTITAGTGKLIDDPTITFGVGRSGTGPRQWQWRSSVDNYASPIPVSTLASGPTQNAGVITCPDTDTNWTGNVIETTYQDLTSVTFRLYGYNSESTTGTGGLAGNLTLGGTLVDSGGALTVSISPASFAESATNPAATGTVTRTGDTSSAVMVNLSSSDESEATVPVSVEILANETQATFPVTAVNDNLPDGNIPVTITATATGLTAGNFQVTVQDDGDVAPVLISQYYEGAGSDKYIELYNPTAGPVDLTGFVLTNWTNASTQDWKSAGNTPTGQLALPAVVIPAGGYYLIKGIGSAAPSYAVDYANLTDSIVVAGFNGDDSVVLYQSNVFSPGNILDAVSFTDAGNQGVDTSFYRLTNDPGYNVTPGSNVTSFPAVWGSKTLAQVAAAQVGDPWVLRGSAEPVGLALSISPASFLENAGNDIATGTVTIPSSLEANLTVNLSSSDTTEATVPASVTIDAGQTSATFPVNAVDDGILDGAQSVVIDASATGYLNGLFTLTVNDDGEAVPAPTLSPGAIAFVGYNADGTDDLAFVALSPIAAGDKIYITDNEWNGEPVGGTGAFNTGEGLLVWTAPVGGVAAGTVVTLNSVSTTSPATNQGTVTRSGNFFANADSETIYAYQGNLVGASGFLAGIATHAVDSFVGTGLTASHIVYLPEDVDVAIYTGSRSSRPSFAGYLTLLGDTTNNWITEDGSGDQHNNAIAPDLPFDTTVFTLTSGGDDFAAWIDGFEVGLLTGFNDDFDNDGLDNALENILGSDPSVANQGLSAVSTGTGTLKFRHTRNGTPANDLTPSYEWSPDLVNWYASGANAGGVTVTFGTPTVEDAGPPELVEVTASITGTAPKVFARIKVEQN
jgi:hypothetical protein